MTADLALTVTDRRRALTELADLYMAEQSSADRPLTTVLPALLRPSLCAATLTTDAAIAFFDRFARARHLLGAARPDDVDDLERRAERLLDFLVGDAQVAVA